MTRKEAFETKIKPLVEAIRVHCKEHDIPALFDFLINRDDEEGKSNHMTLCCTGSGTDPDKTLMDALLVLSEGSIENALAEILLHAIANNLINPDGKIAVGLKPNSDTLEDMKPINKGNPY